MKKYQNTTSLLRLLNECYPLNWHEIININRHNIFLRPIITFSPTWLANKYSYDSTNIFFKYCSEINLTLTALSHHICYVVNNASCQISYRNININREPHSVSESEYFTAQVIFVSFLSTHIIKFIHNRRPSLNFIFAQVHVLNCYVLLHMNYLKDYVHSWIGHYECNNNL